MKLTAWKTPFFEVERLVCSALASDCSGLEIRLVEHDVVPRGGTRPAKILTVEDLVAASDPIVETSGSRKWRVKFRRVVAFRSEEELFSSRLAWPEARGIARTHVSQDSPWLAELDAFVGWPNFKHYFLMTDHATIEVLSDVEPEVEESTGQVDG